MFRSKRVARIKLIPLFIGLILVVSVWKMGVGLASGIVSLKEEEILSKVSDDGQPLISALYGVEAFPEDDRIEIYVFLLDYYLGEIGTEIHQELVTKVGDRIVPYLIDKNTKPIECLYVYKKSCVEDVKERSRKIAVMIDAIKKGIVLYVEYPKDIGNSVTRNIEVIRIFLDDYRRDKTIYPKTLSALREYVWSKYGYKLIITDPRGKQLLYRSGKNEFDLMEDVNEK